MRLRLAGLVIVAAPFVYAVATIPTVTPAQTVVTVYPGDPVPDLDGSQRLDIAGVEAAECDRMGGSHGATDPTELVTCRNVDY